MIYSQKELRRHLQSYLEGKSGPAISDAVEQAQQQGIDLIDFAHRKRRSRRKATTVPREVLAQAARLAYYCILIPEAEAELMPGFETTPPPISRRDFAFALHLEYPGRLYTLTAPKLRPGDAERILDEPPTKRGGFAPTFKVPRTWPPHIVSGRGGCPPGTLNPWLPEDFLERHVTVENDFGVYQSWTQFWTREALVKPRPPVEPRPPIEPIEPVEPVEPIEPTDAKRILDIFR